MSQIFIFIDRWNKWYRVLRHCSGFGRLESMRYGLWLARSGGTDVHNKEESPWIA